MNPLARALLLGTATGLRTFMGAAWWSGAHPPGSGSVTREARIERLLEQDGVALGMRLAAAAELVGDKLPAAPDRISPGPLAARATMGALLGWAVADNRQERVIACAAGAAAAVLSAYGGYWARRLITEAGAADLPVAAAEDAIAVALAAAGSR